MRGGAAAAVVAAAAMVLSTFAIAPANAADTVACYPTTQKQFDSDIKTDGCTEVHVNSIIKFNEINSVKNHPLLSAGIRSYEGYGKPATYTLGEDNVPDSLTIVGTDTAILRNVTFEVPENTSLNLQGSVVLDDANLAGVDVLGLVGVTGLLEKPFVNSYAGIPSAITVAGGQLDLNGGSHVVSGAKGATQKQYAIRVTRGGSTVNLNSSGNYERTDNLGLDIKINLIGVPVVGGVVDLLNKLIENLLTTERSTTYPTVWGRDAAIYSDSGIASTINISDGSYSANESNNALVLGKGATANIVGGSIGDDNKDGNAIASESGSAVNILAQGQGSVQIGEDSNKEYYIGQVQQNGNEFSAEVNPAATAESSTDENEYNLWLGDASQSDNLLEQLGNLVNDSKRTKLDTAYTNNGETMTVLASAATTKAIYGRKVLTSGTSAAPFTAVNGTTTGTVTLYGKPWVGTQKLDGTAPAKSGKLFAGWYTNESAFNTEDGIQGSTDGVKHHVWDTKVSGFNGTYQNAIVVSPSYSGSLYPHFVSAETLGDVYVQPKENGTKNGKKLFNIRLLSGVDSYNFQNAGFTVEKQDGSGFVKLGTPTSKMLYDFISVQGSKQVYTNSPYAGKDGYKTDLLGTRGDARYLTTLVLKNVQEGTTVRVTPQWTTLDGVTVSGTPVTFTVSTNGAVTKQ